MCGPRWPGGFPTWCTTGWSRRESRPWRCNTAVATPLCGGLVCRSSVGWDKLIVAAGHSQNDSRSSDGSRHRTRDDGPFHQDRGSMMPLLCSGRLPMARNRCKSQTASRAVCHPRVVEQRRGIILPGHRSTAHGCPGWSQMLSRKQAFTGVQCSAGPPQSLRTRPHRRSSLVVGRRCACPTLQDFRLPVSRQCSGRPGERLVFSLTDGAAPGAGLCWPGRRAGPPSRPP